MYELIEEAARALRTPPADFDFSAREDAEEIESKLAETMEKYGGLGLSANQVGLDARVFVMRTQDGIQAFFNPKLTKVSQETDLMKEGCLSFPDIYLMIKRPKVCELTWQDAKGGEHTQLFDGIGARCIQHELDHLNGILFLQRASKFKLERALKARPKEKKKRIEYERRQAIARYIQQQQEAQSDTSERDDNSSREPASSSVV